MNRSLRAGFVPVLALILTGFAFQKSYGQSTSASFSFRAGQSMYIVAFHKVYEPVYGADPANGSIGRREYNVQDLDAEKKVRNEIEKWQFFRVADKPSEADFVFLVNLDGSSMEGLAIPFDAYRQHFKEKFDLDSLRDAAYGRYLAGPLKLPTLSRLSERLIKDFRGKLTKDNKSSDE